ncbi:MAG TPA: alcohol dehydrogenase catalytic domain-containing protein, partial [Planctomycetota bacterium]|nr:alcohol dehydrogenase catalytic domain-containing protein [Planctomycetota bacterium]
MKAAVLRVLGSPLSLEDIPKPTPRAEEILIKVAACGVCHSDLHVMKGEIKFPVPCVLGHEISGVVEELG